MMIFRIHDDGTIYVIEAPEGSKVIEDDDRPAEPALFQVTPGGMTLERRLPCSVVIKAAARGIHGLAILEERAPWSHPEVAIACPTV